MVSQEASAAGPPILSPAQADEPYCYLETVGRVTGKRHTVELWFAAHPDRRSVLILAGGGEATHWVRNIDRQAHVRIRVGGRTFGGRGQRIAGSERETVARQALAAKYQGWREGRPLSRWAATSLPIAIDLQA
jgi:deazaflavin-dependent oxidoreductase (nitroreductase family)